MSSSIPHNKRVITQVPSEVVEYILSFLPAKVVASLSILSQEFKESWKFCRVLSFDRTVARHIPREIYIGIVDRFLEEHIDYEVNRFHVYFDHDGDVDKVHEWLLRAIELRVRELVLDFSPSILSFVLASTFLDCSSIQILELVNCQLDSLFPSKELGNLKELTIRKTIIDSINLELVFSNCLALRIMQLLCCDSIDFLNVQAEKLKSFKTLVVKDCSCILEIRLFAPTLNSFHYHGNLCKFNFPGTFSLLDDVILYMESPRTFRMLLQWQEMITTLHHVRVLTITSTFIEGLGKKYQYCKFAKVVFSLMNVKELQLVILRESNTTPLDILKFLTKCPNVEKVFIKVKKDSLGNSLYWNLHGRSEMNQFYAIFTSIKQVKIKGFTINELPMTLARSLLSCAKNLRKFVHIKGKYYDPLKVLTPDRLSSQISTNAQIDIFEYGRDKSVIFPMHRVR